MAEDLPQIPGYTVKKHMGQGGMATVYLAVQENFGRDVALKIMSDELGQDDVWARRFIHEAKVVAQLSHPSIVPVFDVGTYEGRYYISMELLKGGMLEDKIAHGLSIPEVVKIIVGVAAGLDYAGEKGFVHRDIKPDNVMFREDGSPVILDFGIVKQMGGGSGDKMTQTGTIVGTTAYMSPEQAMGKELDQRSDIYSLGIMMYELLAGRTPFQGDSAVEVLMKHVQEPPAPLPDFVSIFQPVIDRSLAKNKEDRYSRAREMIEHIQELEPQIKEVIAKQKAALGGGGTAGGATVAQGAVDATVQTEQIAEEDLTSVLSSAQATIDNFSEAARAKRARNTKRAIAAAIVVAIGALAYVAYQQFYAIPKTAEMAEKARQKKIDNLLDAAESAESQLVISNLSSADEVIAQYREILVVDAENTEALEALSDLGGEYVKLAQTALDDKNLKLADTYQDYAKDLAPGHKDLPALNKALTDFRAANAELLAQQQAQQDQIDTLLGNADKSIAAGNIFSPPGNNAYDQLQQILKIDAEHVEAQKKITEIIDELYSTTEKQISAGSLSSARGNINLLQGYSDDAARLAGLQSSYDTAKRRADQQASAARAAQKKEELLSKASRLSLNERTVALNDEIRELYLSVLDMDPGNFAAKDGLNNTSDFLASQAKASIKKRDYSRAGLYLNEIKRYTPDYSSLSRLQDELSTAKNSSEKADQLLSSARQLASSGKRSDLASAYQQIEQASLADPNNPAIGSVLSTLESAYVSVIRQLIAGNQTSDAKAYLDDAAPKNWPTNRIFELQQTLLSSGASKPKPKKVMTGGF